MIENTNAEQSQVATDEIEIKVTEDNYDDQGNAPENNQPQDELETYTKGVSRRINKLNQRHRAAEERAAQLEQIAHQKEQELQQYKQYTAQMGGTMLQKEAENLNSKELQVDEIYKKAVESNDAELMSKATTLKNELAIQKEKLNVASQNQQAESQQQAQWQQQQQQQSQQQYQEYAEGGEVDEEPTDEAVTWHEKNSWYGDKSDPQNVEATQFAYYTHFNLLNEGFDADSDEYYSALDSRVERAYPHVKSVESTSSGSSADENRQRPAVQKVASTQHMGRQQTRGIKKSDVHFSQSELERLRGLKPHNMSEQDWLQRVAKEKQKKLSQGVR